MNEKTATLLSRHPRLVERPTNFPLPLALARLIKSPLTLAVAAVVAAGFFLRAGALSAGALAATVGAFLMAAGACALNQIQERDIDARMERTRLRPLPMGELSPGVALAWALALLLSGGALLWAQCGAQSAALGAIAVLCYNAVYTPLKPYTPLAFIPGSFVGAIPPLLGWSAAGGSLVDPGILVIALFFILWQWPHLLALTLAHDADYAAGGLPTLASDRAPLRCRRLFLASSLLAACSGTILVFLYRGTNAPWLISLGGLSASVLFFLRVFRSPPVANAYRSAFAATNIYAAAVLFLLCAGKALS